MIPAPSGCELCKCKLVDGEYLDVPFRKQGAAALVYLCLLCATRVAFARDRFHLSLAAEAGIITHELSSTKD
jgi:RNase P subunit RPR2